MSGHDGFMAGVKDGLRLGLSIVLLTVIIAGGVRAMFWLLSMPIAREVEQSLTAQTLLIMVPVLVLLVVLVSLPMLRYTGGSQ